MVDFRHFPQLQNHSEKHFDFENMGLALHHSRQPFQHLDLEKLLVVGRVLLRSLEAFLWVELSFT